MIAELLWAIFVTGIILILAYLFTRHIVGRTALGGWTRGRHIAVLEQVSLGKDQRLILVRMGECVYFLAVSSGGVTVLKEFAQEEAETFLQENAPRSSAPEGFAQALHRVLEQRKK